MLRSILLSAVATLALSADAFGQEWTDWIYVSNEDPINDRVTHSVASQEERYSPAFVYLACNSEQAWLAFSDGEFILHDARLPKVSVRFDDGEVMEFHFSDLRRNPTFLVHWDSSVARFAEGLRTGSRIAFRIDEGRTHSFDLTGAAEAIAQLEAGCELPVREPAD